MSRTLVLPLLLAMAACVRLDTGVTAYAVPRAALPKRYTLQGPDPSRPGGDPRWPVLAAMVAKALATGGFVQDEAAPEFILQVSYGSGDREVHHERTQSKATPGHATSTSTRSYESVAHFIRLEALDPASVAAGDPRVIWSTHGEMRGTYPELAEAIPYMLASMEAHFGKVAESKVVVVKRPWDAEAERLKRR